MTSETHIGYVREENQDRVGSRQFGENLLLLVCDGMGGERSGSKASSLASEVFFENFEEGYEPDMDHYSMRSLLLSSISAANSVVYTSARTIRILAWGRPAWQRSSARPISPLPM